MNHMFLAILFNTRGKLPCAVKWWNKILKCSHLLYCQSLSRIIYIMTDIFIIVNLWKCGIPYLFLKILSKSFEIYLPSLFSSVIPAIQIGAEGVKRVWSYWESVQLFVVLEACCISFIAFVNWMIYPSKIYWNNNLIV